MEENKIEINKNKIKIFFERKLKIHITKKDAFFINGIVKKIFDKYFYIDDVVRGRQICFYDEIKYIQLYQEKEGDKDGD